MSNTNKYDEELENKDELDRLYQIYLRVQSGDKSALDELFKAKTVNVSEICKADEDNKKSRMQNMDNVLDAEFVIENEKENEKSKQENEWLNSSNSIVDFAFPILRKMLYNKKRKFLSKEKNIGYKSGNHSKFYSGEYEVSDIDSVVYDTILEIFTRKTDKNHHLTIDDKKNEGVPIKDGVSLMKNISYFVSMRINIRQEKMRCDVPIISYFDGESQEEISLLLDRCAFDDFLVNGDDTSQLAIYGDRTDPEIIQRRPAMYQDYLSWLEMNDICDLFKCNACDIKAIIETILKCPDTFEKNSVGDIKSGFGARFVTQEALQKIIKSKCGVNIEQENISKDLKEIEQRLLDHLFYSLNYKIGKASESSGIFEKESNRFLYERDEKLFWNNLKNEDEYVDNNLREFTKIVFPNWNCRYWEAELDCEKLKIRMWTSKDTKNPVRHIINRENLKVYKGYKNYYFCDTQNIKCYILPTNRRVITRSNNKHEVLFRNIK